MLWRSTPLIQDYNHSNYITGEGTCSSANILKHFHWLMFKNIVTIVILWNYYLQITVCNMESTQIYLNKMCCTGELILRNELKNKHINVLCSFFIGLMFIFVYFSEPVCVKDNILWYWTLSEQCSVWTNQESMEWHGPLSYEMRFFTNCFASSRFRKIGYLVLCCKD